MTGIQPNAVEQTLRISARPETVWKYWTDPRRMGDWWGAAELEPWPGGVYRVGMASGHVMIGQYLELVPHERLVFTFGYEPAEGSPAIAPGASRVEVTLIEDGGGTILTVRHTGIPGALTEMHASGWTHHLPLLAAAAIHGDV